MTTIIMTGGTSGLGLEAAKKLVSQKDVKLIIGYRSKGVDGAVSIPLNLASLASVKAFANEAISNLDNEKIDVLICNAAVNYPLNDQRTEDGVEMNFGVNHVAHVFLVQLLIPYLSPRARIILTTSGTIDPERKTLAAPPKHANVHWLAYPENDQTVDEDEVNGRKRGYASSKICNLMTAMYINKMGNDWEGVSYDPGLTLGTGLIRHSGEELKALARQLEDDQLRREKFPESNTKTDAGKTLADIALGKVKPPVGAYVALRGGQVRYLIPPGLAKDDQLPEKVWNDTIAMLKNKLKP